MVPVGPLTVKANVLLVESKANSVIVELEITEKGANQTFMV